MKAIIFDMDGVLVNSVRYVWDAFNKILGKYNVKISDKEMKKSLGMSLRDKISLWKKDYDLPNNIDENEFSRKSFEIEQELMKEHLKPDYNIMKLIKSAKEAGVKIAVATSSTKERAKKILEIIGVFDELDVLVTAEDVEKHKPNPQIFLEAAKRLDVEPENCVVFEDALNGIQAARRARMKSVAILTEFTKKEDLKKLADLVINNFSEIKFKDLKKLLF